MLDVDVDLDAFAAEWATSCAGREMGVVGTCAEAVRLLVARFPALVAVRGHVRMLDAPAYERAVWPHWWATKPGGEVVDPTRAQFPGRVAYEPLDEARGEPTGRCPNCGELAYDHRYVCSDACEREHAAYCSGSAT